MGIRHFAVGLALALLVPGAGEAQDAIANAVAPCGSCHGAAGVPSDETIPIIQGQRADYIAAQLRAYRAGSRDSQIMTSMAESLKRADIPAISAAIATKGWPKPDPAASAAAPAAVVVCQGCHGADLLGGESPVGPAPRLAGQNAAYLKNQMVAFATVERPNQAVMSALMKALDAKDRDAIAAYLAGL